MRYEIRPSRLLHTLLVMLHGVAFGAVLLADLGTPLHLLATGLIIASLVWRLGWLLGTPPRAFIFRTRPNGALERLADGEWAEIDLRPDTFVHPWLVVLRFRPAQSRRVHALAILPDALAPEAFRQLRVWLRHVAVTAEPAAAPAQDTQP